MYQWFNAKHSMVLVIGCVVLEVLNSNVTPRLSSCWNSYISLIDSGIDSTLPRIHNGHISMLERRSKHDAHQKHDPHIKKYDSFRLISFFSSVWMALIMIRKQLRRRTVTEICYITLFSEIPPVIRVYVIRRMAVLA